MSTFFQKADGKCHHCKTELPIEEELIEKVLWMECSSGYICKNCGELNAWQDPSIGTFLSFIYWLGRRFW